MTYRTEEGLGDLYSFIASRAPGGTKPTATTGTTAAINLLGIAPTLPKIATAISQPVTVAPRPSPLPLTAAPSPAPAPAPLTPGFTPLAPAPIPVPVEQVPTTVTVKPPASTPTPPAGATYVPADAAAPDPMTDPFTYYYGGGMTPAGSSSSRSLSPITSPGGGGTFDTTGLELPTDDAEPAAPASTQNGAASPRGKTALFLAGGLALLLMAGGKRRRR